MSLKIYSLGQFKLQADDVPLELPSRPAQSLLAYLTLNAGVTQRREKLAGILWPDSTETNARRYLRQALWRIRKTLECGGLSWADYLHISDISVSFDHQSDFWSDVHALLESVEALSVEEIIEVIRLYRGELLSGFYDEWVILERDRLQAAFHQKINLLLDRLVQSGQWGEVIEWSEHWISFGSTPEPAYRALMSAYASLGDQGMVSASYQRCLDALGRELDVEPSTETAQLYEHILRRESDPFVHRPVLQKTPSSRQPSFLSHQGPPSVERPIFVAREDELAQLDSHLDLASGGQGKVIFITGEAGIGKTALMNKFTCRVQDNHPDLIVASGTCNAHTGIGDPYLPFREILEMLTGDVEARYAARTITQEQARYLWNAIPVTARAVLEAGPDLIDTFIPGPALVERAVAKSPSGSTWLIKLDELVKYKTHLRAQDAASGSGTISLLQGDLFEQYTRVLQSLARQGSLVLVLDDLQWADLGSISLLFHLGRHLAGYRILIVGVYRPEEIALGREGARHPLEPVVNEFQRDFGDITVNVGQAEGRDFIEAILDTELNKFGSPFREMLYRQTRGQPLFTIELLRGLQDRGDLVQDPEGYWVEGSTLNWETLPARVEAVIAERIGRLAPPLRAALRVASVEGETFTAEVVARVQGSDDREILGSMSTDLDRTHRLISAHNIQRLDGQLLSCYRFRHNLFQKYLYSSLDEVERVHLHEQVGTALEELFGAQDETKARADITVQLARHFQEARIPEKAIHYLHQAGKRGVQLSAYQEGFVHLTRALDLLMTLPESPERDQQELALQLSISMTRMGEIPSPEWEKPITRARVLSQKLGKTAQLCRVMGEISIFHYVCAEYQKAREFGEEALSMAQQAGDPLLIALGHWCLGFIFFALGEFTTARTHNQQVIAFYDPEQHHRSFLSLRGSDPGVSVIAYDALCLWCLGYPERALKRSQDALNLVQELNHAYTLADVLCFGGCFLHAWRRDTLALKDDAKHLMQLSKEIGFSGWLEVGTCYLGEAMAKLGQLQEGITLIRKGIAARHSIGERCFQSGILSALAEAQAELGYPEDGLATLDEALAWVEESDERYWEAEVHRLRAELLLKLGDETQAEASYQNALQISRRMEAKSLELRAATGLARFWLTQGKTQEAHNTLREVNYWFTEGFDTPDLLEANALLDELTARS